LRFILRPISKSVQESSLIDDIRRVLSSSARSFYILRVSRIQIGNSTKRSPKICTYRSSRYEYVLLNDFSCRLADALIKGLTMNQSTVQVNKSRSPDGMRLAISLTSVAPLDSKDGVVHQIPMSRDRPLGSAVEAVPIWIPSGARETAISSAPIQQKTVRLGDVDPPHLALLRNWLKPTIVAATLFACCLLSRQSTGQEFFALALTAMLISRQIFSPLRLSANLLRRLRPDVARVLLQWSAVVGLLLILGFALRITDKFPRIVILSWFALTPIALTGCDYWSARTAARRHSARHRYIIIGANEVGVELARRTALSANMGTFMGFFDFRSRDRLPENARIQLAGTCDEAAAFVRRCAINAIYIALPMSRTPRINEMLQDFRDTTASIYFVPDIFAFDLVQARCGEINGIPVLSVCDTPFLGMNAVNKRAIDLILASFALLLVWPIMLLAAIAVLQSSPGPVLFKQRRYGLNGEEILVYKFRSMTVCEDGPVVVQAIKKDRRVTSAGAFLRRTSLDELPQLFNVFRGTMSFVGPRPHAVAHNELYRKLINGYMLRHKIRPGITGWAQVNGLCGETRTLEQMRLRVQHDLEYLEHWSLWLDLKILLKTAFIVFRGRDAH
jgi:putative colanic acid biosynthesis UDP-glucose lipid carrier transferase